MKIIDNGITSASVEKLENAVKTLIGSKLYGSGSRLAMNNRTKDAVFRILMLQDPFNVDFGFNCHGEILEYCGTRVLIDNTLEHGEVLVLAEVV